MIAGIGGLDGLRREAHLTFVRHLARRLTYALDGIAGTRGLTSAERALQEVCRDRFMLYDPSCDRQVRFVIELEELARCSESRTSGRRSSGGSASVVEFSRPGSAHGGSAHGGPGCETDDRDELMAALLQPEETTVIPLQDERHSQRPDQHPLRRPEPCSRRREDWSDYLGQWRGRTA